MSCIVTAIIITKDEALHIARCIDSVKNHVSRIVVVDSGSQDKTENIVLNKGCEFYFHPWKGYANQINWAIEKVSKTSDWILRIDADEVINESQLKVKEYLSKLSSEINGLNVKRNVYFNKQLVKSGGVYNKKILRIIRSGFGQCDNKLMDEHLISEDLIIDSPFTFSDISLIDFKEFICKHIDYANLEVNSMFDKKKSELARYKYAKNTTLRSFLKEYIYYKFPPKLRPFLFYFYRLFLRGGIFDRTEGFYYHLFQGLMYRSFVEYIYFKKNNQNKKIHKKKNFL